MINKMIEISKINGSKEYWFDPETGMISRQDPKEQPNDLPPFGSRDRAKCFRGTFKRFLIGGTLVLYRLDDKYLLQWRKHSWALDDECLKIQRTVIGPWRILNVKHKNFNRSFFEWFVLSKFQKSIDPTFDYIDEMSENFTGEIIEKYAECRKKPSPGAPNE